MVYSSICKYSFDGITKPCVIKESKFNIIEEYENYLQEIKYLERVTKYKFSAQYYGCAVDLKTDKLYIMLEKLDFSLKSVDFKT